MVSDELSLARSDEEIWLAVAFGDRLNRLVLVLYLLKGSNVDLMVEDADAEP